MNRRIQEKLVIWERKILRRIFEGKKLDDTWKILETEDTSPALRYLEKMGTARFVKNVDRSKTNKNLLLQDYFDSFIELNLTD